MRPIRSSGPVALAIAALSLFPLVLPGCKGRFKLPADARFVTQIALGGGFGCSRMKDGSVRCWGANDAGQLGDGTVTDRHEPVKVAAAARFTTVATGAHHACAITGDGDVVCWGANDAGQAGGPPGASRL